MLNAREVEQMMTSIGYNQPIKGKHKCWVKADCNTIAFYMPASLLTKNGACYAIRRGNDLQEAFSVEELKAKCLEMERRGNDNV